MVAAVVVAKVAEAKVAERATDLTEYKSMKHHSYNN